jgi:hypothetical protein
MSTRAQIAANARNAQLSTGAKTEEGKAASAKNNTSHGLTITLPAGTPFKVMPWESQLDFEARREELRKEHQPITPTEHLLVDGMAQYHWLSERAVGLQQGCFDPETRQISDQKSFALYLRYETTHQRAFHKCLNDLLKLRAEKRKSEIGFESQRRQEDAHIRQQEQHAIKKQNHRVAMLDLKMDAENRNTFDRLSPEKLAAKWGFEIEPNLR